MSGTVLIHVCRLCVGILIPRTGDGHVRAHVHYEVSAAGPRTVGHGECYLSLRDLLGFRLIYYSLFIRFAIRWHEGIGLDDRAQSLCSTQ